MKKVNNEPRDLSGAVAVLKKRPGMFVQPVNFETLVAFISGYDQAMFAIHGKSELAAFRLWLEEKLGHACSLSWSALIRDVFAKKNREAAVDQLFELFGEYAALDKKAKAG